MKLRGRLDEVKVFSIEHLHTHEDNVRLIKMAEAVLIGPPGISPWVYELIIHTRFNVNVYTLNDVREEIGASARRAGQVFQYLIKEKYLRWKSDYLVFAPFPMDWGKTAWRYTEPQPMVGLEWVRDIVARRIALRPGPADTVADPRWGIPRELLKRSRRRIVGGGV